MCERYRSSIIFTAFQSILHCPVISASLFLLFWPLHNITCVLTYKKKKKKDETLFLSYCKNYTCLELKIKKNYGKRKKSCLISASSGLWFWSRKCWPVMLWARSPQYLPTYNLQAGEFRDGISSFSCLQALVAELW